MNLKQVLKDHSLWLSSNGSQGNRANLEEVNLQGADLREANLHGANLREAYLQGANLVWADLRGADLRGVYLQEAYLYGADLRGAYLQGADLYGANLQEAYLYGAYLREVNLQGAYLCGTDLRGADLRGAYLQRTYLCGAKFSCELAFASSLENVAYDKEQVSYLMLNEKWAAQYLCRDSVQVLVTLRSLLVSGQWFPLEAQENLSRVTLE